MEEYRIICVIRLDELSNTYSKLIIDMIHLQIDMTSNDINTQNIIIGPVSIPSVFLRNSLYDL